jgi:hypothetical protein
MSENQFFKENSALYFAMNGADELQNLTVIYIFNIQINNSNGYTYGSVD